LNTSISNTLSSPGQLSDLARLINEAHASALTSARTTLEHARQVGTLLVEAKAAVGHGKWLPWLSENVAFSVRSAQQYMDIAGRWHEIPNAQSVAHLTEATELLAVARHEIKRGRKTRSGPEFTLPPPLAWLQENTSLTSAHVSQLLRAKTVLRDLQLDCSHWKGKIHPASFEDAKNLWFMLRRGLCPEDAPLCPFSEIVLGTATVDEMFRLKTACEAFDDYVVGAGYSIPAWIRGAFWWGCVAVYLDLSVAVLTNAISNWQERFYSCVAIMMLHPVPDASTPRLEQLEWWAARGDLRHAGASEWASNAPREVKLEALRCRIVGPSDCQAWGQHGEEYARLVAEDDSAMV